MRYHQLLTSQNPTIKRTREETVLYQPVTNIQVIYRSFVFKVSLAKEVGTPIDIN